MKYLAAAVACSVAACGGTTAHEPHEITLTVTALPNYLQYRDGGGPWQQPPSNGDGTYRLTVSDSYEVVAVRAGDVVEVRATSDEVPAPLLDLGPAVVVPGPQPTHHVTGTVDGNTGVAIDTPPEAAQPPGPISQNNVFTIGSFDTSAYLFAFGAYQNQALTRVARIAITPGDDNNVGFISVASTGMNIPTHLVGVDNQVNTPYVTIDGPGRLPLRFRAPIDGVAFDMLLLPAPMRAPGDHYAVTVEAGTFYKAQTYRNTDGVADLGRADAGGRCRPPTVPGLRDVGRRRSRRDAVGERRQHHSRRSRHGRLDDGDRRDRAGSPGGAAGLRS